MPIGKEKIQEKIGMFLGYCLAGILAVGMAAAMIIGLFFVMLPFVILIMYACSFEAVRILIQSC